MTETEDGTECSWLGSSQDPRVPGSLSGFLSMWSRRLLGQMCFRPDRLEARRPPGRPLPAPEWLRRRGAGDGPSLSDVITPCGSNGCLEGARKIEKRDVLERSTDLPKSLGKRS